MKKQILTFLIAILGFSSIGLAQSIKNTDGNLLVEPTYCVDATPITATCVADADPLHPSLGVTYTYTVNVTPDVSNTTPNTGYIHWFVTTEPNIIADGVLTTDIELVTDGYILAAGASYNTTANISESVDISWESVPTTEDLFLVTFVKKNDGCTDNVKVYKIEPQHIFTLDMAYLNAITGIAAGANTDCVAPVFDAFFDATILPAGEMVMDYGVNYIYFVVNAANWGHSWKPSFEFVLTGTPDNGLTTSSATAIDWATPAESVTGGWHNASNGGTGNIYTSTDNVTPQTTGASAVGTDGECIVVRVTIDHNQNETTMDIPFTLAVNGIMFDGTDYTNPLLADIHHADGPAGECPWYDNYTNDKLSYTLTLRPTIVDNTPDTPNATDFILDNSEQP